jgi:hypothetical protein
MINALFRQVRPGLLVLSGIIPVMGRIVQIQRIIWRMPLFVQIRSKRDMIMIDRFSRSAPVGSECLFKELVDVPSPFVNPG